MRKSHLISNKMSKFNFLDRIPKAKIRDFEKRYEKFAQIPTIANGWLARSPHSSTFQQTHPSDAAYIVHAQKNLRQVFITTCKMLRHFYTDTKTKFNFVSCKDIQDANIKRHRCTRYRNKLE